MEQVIDSLKPHEEVSERSNPIVHWRDVFELEKNDAADGTAMIPTDGMIAEAM